MKTNYKMSLLGDGKVQIQENVNWKFGKSKTIELGEEMKDLSLTDLMEVLNEQVIQTDWSMDTVEQNISKNDSSIESPLNSKLIKIIKEIPNYSSLIKIIAYTLLIFIWWVIVWYWTQPYSDINNKKIINVSNKSKTNKISTVNEKVTEIQENNVTELNLQKDLRSKREKRRKEWETEEKYYNDLIIQSKTRVWVNEKDIAFYKNQMLILSSQVDTLTGIVQPINAIAKE